MIHYWMQLYHLRWLLILTPSVRDVTALESARVCRKSDATMGSGSTPGAVPACYNSLRGNWCWGSMCDCFSWDSRGLSGRRTRFSSIWHEMDSLCVSDALGSCCMALTFLWGVWEPGCVCVCLSVAGFSHHALKDHAARRRQTCEYLTGYYSSLGSFYLEAIRPFSGLPCLSRGPLRSLIWACVSI